MIQHGLLPHHTKPNLARAITRIDYEAESAGHTHEQQSGDQIIRLDSPRQCKNAVYIMSPRPARKPKYKQALKTQKEKKKGKSHATIVQQATP